MPARRGIGRGARSREPGAGAARAPRRARRRPPALRVRGRPGRPRRRPGGSDERPLPGKAGSPRRDRCLAWPSRSPASRRRPGPQFPGFLPRHGPGARRAQSLWDRSIRSEARGGCCSAPRCPRRSASASRGYGSRRAVGLLRVESHGAERAADLPALTRGVATAALHEPSPGRSEWFLAPRAGLLVTQRLERIDAGSPPRRQPGGEQGNRGEDDRQAAVCPWVGGPDFIELTCQQPAETVCAG